MDSLRCLLPLVVLHKFFLQTCYFVLMRLRFFAVSPGFRFCDNRIGLYFTAQYRFSTATGWSGSYDKGGAHCVLLFQSRAQIYLPLWLCSTTTLTFIITLNADSIFSLIWRRCFHLIFSDVCPRTAMTVLASFALSCPNPSATFSPPALHLIFSFSTILRLHDNASPVPLVNFYVFQFSHTRSSL